jgi:hypothetical protein
MGAYPDTFDVIRYSEGDDGYGGINATASFTTLVEDWECRLSRASGQLMQQTLGKVLDDSYAVTGATTSGVTIVEGDFLSDGTTEYEIIYATLQRNKYGEGHHWHLLCSKH